MKNRMTPKCWSLPRLLPALLALVLFAGCVKTGLEEDEKAKSGYVILNAGIQTFAAAASADPNAQGAAEYVIRRVRLYAFDGDKLDKMMYVEDPASGETGEIAVRMQVKQTAAKTLYVIVNEPDDAVVHSRLALIDNPAAFAEAEYAMANYFTDSQKAFNSDAAFEADAFCLPMSGQLGPFNTISTIDVPVTLRVTRSLARVDVMLQKNTDVAPDVTVNSSSKLDITATRAKGLFFGDRLASGQSGDLSNVTSAATGPAAGLLVPVRNADNNDAAVRAFTFYTPERDCAANKLGFKLKGVDFSGRTVDYEVTIGNEDGNKLTKIERNKVYRIWCTLKSVATDVEMEVLDWSDVLVNGDIDGGAMLVVDRSRVVMDYAQQNSSYTTQVNFVSDGNVSFVGYVIKNADGTDASVTTDGSNLPAWLPKDNITGLPDGSAMSGAIALTYVPTTSGHPDVSLRLKTGNIIKDITAVYDNGLIPESALPAAWTLNRPGIGLQVAKRGSVLPREEALTQDLSLYWAKGVEDLGIQNTGYGYGASNTDVIVASQYGAVDTHAAACRKMGAEWYLPSRDELRKIALSQPLFGPSYTFTDPSVGTYYASSSEYDVSSVWRVEFKNNTYIETLSDGGAKAGADKGRCVRDFDFIRLSTTALAADYYAWGNSFSATVEFESFDGTAVSLLSDGYTGPTKNWLTDVDFSGTTKGKVTFTYRPTDYATHDDITFTFKTAKGNTKIFTLSYDNGLIPASELPAAWTVNRPGVGIQLSKRGNILPTRRAAGDDIRKAWSPLLAEVGAAARNSGYGYGVSNTDAIVASTSGSGSVAQDCRDLGPDWYLSSSDELLSIYTSRGLFGPSYTFIESNYWSSTEIDANNSWYVYFIYGGIQSGTYKSIVTNGSRCVRGIDVIKLSTNDLTADYVAWGNKFSTTVDFESFDGSAVSVRSVDNTGATKNWLTKVALAGTLKGKIELTYELTLINPKNQVHDDVVITLQTAKGNTTTLTVRYDNGLIPASALPAEWTNNRPGKWLQVAKIGNKLPTDKAGDAEQKGQWSPTTIGIGYYAQFMDCGYGIDNTNAIVGSSAGPGSAAEVCRNLGPEWYLPSRYELKRVYNLQGYVGGSSYAFLKSYQYWSSTEYDNGTTQAWYVDWNYGNDLFWNKDFGEHYFRCVRNLD